MNKWHFVGRERELAALEKQYVLPEFNLMGYLLGYYTTMACGLFALLG
jgi:hypothetical protein